MILGNAATASARLIVWCLDCHRQVEPDPRRDGRVLWGRDDRPGLAGVACLLSVRQAIDAPRWRRSRRGGLAPRSKCEAQALRSLRINDVRMTDLDAALTPLGANPPIEQRTGVRRCATSWKAGGGSTIWALALQVRALAREARFPAARRALMEIAKRFERGAGATKTRISPATVDNPVYNLEQRRRISTVPTTLNQLPKIWAPGLTHCHVPSNLWECATNP